LWLTLWYILIFTFQDVTESNVSIFASVSESTCLFLQGRLKTGMNPNTHKCIFIYMFIPCFVPNWEGVCSMRRLLDVAPIAVCGASLPFPPPLLPSLPALLASLHSLLLHNRQVAQCSVSCPFLPDIACHYVSLCRSLISPSPSLHFLAANGESTWDPGVFIIIIIIFPYWWLS